MRSLRVAFCLLAAVALHACAGTPPPNLGVSSGALSPCPSTPNCVSSAAPDADHRVDAFELSVPPSEAWSAIREEVANLPRTTVLEATPSYLHAESVSLVFRFADDLELRLLPSDDAIAVRSASRMGRSDFGVNRRRVEDLRAALRERGVVR